MKREMGSISLAILLVMVVHSSAIAEVRITAEQLAQLLASGPRRVKLDFDLNGKVTRVYVDDSSSRPDKLEDRLTKIDGNTLILERLGRVSLERAASYEGFDHQRIERRVWLDEVARALAAGDAVLVEAEGMFSDTGLHARVLEATRVELPPATPVPPAPLELDAVLRQIDVDTQAGTLRFGPSLVSYGGARIEVDSDIAHLVAVPPQKQ